MAKTQSRRRTAAATRNENATDEQDTNVAVAEEETPDESTNQNVETDGDNTSETKDSTKYSTRTQNHQIKALSSLVYYNENKDNDGFKPRGFQLETNTLPLKDSMEIILGLATMQFTSVADFENRIKESGGKGEWSGMDEAPKSYTQVDYTPVLERAEQEGLKGIETLKKSQVGYLFGDVVIKMADGRNGFARLVKERELGYVITNKDGKEEMTNDYVVVAPDDQEEDWTLEQKIAYAKRFQSVLDAEKLESQIVAFPVEVEEEE